MKKILKLTGIIALLLVIGFWAVSCGDNGGGGSNAGDNTGGNGGGVAVTGVTLNQSSLSLTESDTATLTAIVLPSNATNKAVSWSSSNSNIATVSNGEVTAVSVGTATITVTTSDKGKTANCAVTVTPIVTPTTGTFTVTGIPSQYNGYYAVLAGGSNNITLYGFQSATSREYMLSKISNGIVNIPLWKEDGASLVRYSGNDTIDSITVFIKGGSSLNDLSVIVGSYSSSFKSVTFSNGSATRIWN